MEAKTAWAATGSGIPSDLSAVKLCPSPSKQIAVSAAPATHPPMKAVDSFVSGVDAQAHLCAASQGHHESVSPNPTRIAKLAFFSPSLFVRPPPGLYSQL